MGVSCLRDRAGEEEAFGWKNDGGEGDLAGEGVLFFAAGVVVALSLIILSNSSLSFLNSPTFFSR